MPALAEESFPVRFFVLEAKTVEELKPPTGAAADQEPEVYVAATMAERARLPEQSVIKYIPRLGKLFVRSSADGHQRVDEILTQLHRDGLHQPPPMVAVGFVLVELPVDQLEHADGLHTGRLDYTASAEVLRMFRAGQGTLLAMNQVVTLSGERAEIETEHSLRFPRHGRLYGIFSGPRSSSELPDLAFSERRQRGTTLAVKPTVRPGGAALELELKAVKTELSGWMLDPRHDDGSDVADSADAREGAAPTPDAKRERLAYPMQPVFRSFTVDATFAASPGDPVVLGVAANDAHQAFPDGGRRCFGIVTARLIDVRPR